MNKVSIGVTIIIIRESWMKLKSGWFWKWSALEGVDMKLGMETLKRGSKMG